MEFFHDGSLALEIMCISPGVSATYMIKVNDQYVSLTPTTAGTSGLVDYIKLTFASIDKRRISFLGAFGFGGVATGPNDSIEPAPVRGPKVMWVGDSFLGGTGSTSTGTQQSFAQTVSDLLCWDDITMNAYGGTGWLATNSGAAYNYLQRLPLDVIPRAPQIIIYSGGINDGNNYSYSQIYSQALSVLTTAKAALPGILQIVTGSFWRSAASTITTGMLDCDLALQAAANAAGALWIPVFNQALPSYITPKTAQLFAQASNGATSFQIALDGNSNPVFPAGSVVLIGSNSPLGQRQMALIKTVSGSPSTYNIDGSFLATYPAGTPVTQVGDCFWSGTGYAGATTGYGNADLYVSLDDEHPSNAGHYALGKFLASRLANVLSF